MKKAIQTRLRGYNALFAHNSSLSQARHTFNRDMKRTRQIDLAADKVVTFVRKSDPEGLWRRAS